MAVLTFTPAAKPQATFDPAFTALPLLRRLAETLVPAMDFADRVEASRRFNGEPEVFFFHGRSPSARGFADTPEAVRVARLRPDLAASWAALADLVDDAFTLAAADARVRHAARAVPRLQPRLRSLANCHARCGHFAELLDVVDDEVAVVIEPHTGRGWRTKVQGVADLGQFHMLFADLVPNLRPERTTSDAYRFEPSVGPATAVVQFHAPEALSRDGSLTLGLKGNTHWLWENQPFRSMPRIRGERVLLIAPPAYPRQWIAQRRFAAVEGNVELLQVLSVNDVRQRLTGMGATITHAARMAA